MQLAAPDRLHDDQKHGHHPGQSGKFFASAGERHEPGCLRHGASLDEAQDALWAVASTKTGLFHPTHRSIDAGERAAVALVDVDAAGDQLVG